MPASGRMTFGTHLHHSYSRNSGTPSRSQEQLGHSLQMLFSTYAHVIDDLRGQKAARAVDLIEKARKAQSDVPKLFPKSQKRPIPTAKREPQTIS